MEEGGGQGPVCCVSGTRDQERGAGAGDTARAEQRESQEDDR